MSAADGNGTAFVDYFRCPADAGRFSIQPQRSETSGYFHFRQSVAYGRCAGIQPASHVSGQLTEVADLVSVRDGVPQMPFDISEVTANLRQERYELNGYTFLERATSWETSQRLYYLLRPLMGVAVRKHLQKIRLRGWKNIRFPEWPVDVSVERLMENAMAALLAGRRRPIPFIWFWPDGASACGMMTHDVEGPAGVDFCDALMDLDDAYGIKSAFQLVPEGREDVWRRTAAKLRGRGFEVNLHDLNHDGLLFADREEFLRRAARINQYAREFGCAGFRSGAMYREQSWFEAFEFSYDMSVPNAAHLEPQRGGCCTVMPYFVGDMLELPLTTTQDYSLFHILGDYSTTLWRQQMDVILRRHGLISVITHPDYLTGAAQREVYIDLLKHLGHLRDHAGLWIAQPGEVNEWWRNRDRMTLVPEESGWRVAGQGSERARVAYARLDGERVTYSFSAPASE